MKLSENILNKYIYANEEEMLASHIANCIGINTKVTTISEEIENPVKLNMDLFKGDLEASLDRIGKVGLKNIKDISNIEIDTKREIVTFIPKTYVLEIEINQEFYSSTGETSIKLLKEELEKQLKDLILTLDMLTKEVKELNAISKIRDDDKKKKEIISKVNSTFGSELSEDASISTILQTMLKQTYNKYNMNKNSKNFVPAIYLIFFGYILLYYIIVIIISFLIGRAIAYIMNSLIKFLSSIFSSSESKDVEKGFNDIMKNISKVISLEDYAEKHPDQFYQIVNANDF